MSKRTSKRRSSKRTSRPRALEPNSPEKRIEFVLKTYWKKYPNQCIDTTTVAAFLFGVDHDAPSALLRSQYAWRQFEKSDREQNALLGQLDDWGGSKVVAREMFTRLGNQTITESPWSRQDWALVSLVVFIVRNFPKHHEYESIVPWVARELVAVSKAKPLRWQQDSETRWRGFPADRELPPDPGPGFMHGDRDVPVVLVHERIAGVGTWTGYVNDVSFMPTVEKLDDAKHFAEQYILTDLREELVGLLKQKITAIAQWAKETRTDIGKATVAQALDAIATYTFKTSLVPQGTVVFSFPDGWTVQELTTREQLGGEGKTMQHCVGSYASQVEQGVSRIYSLRDPSGNPHVTMEWAPETGNVHGRGFGKYTEPGDPEWDEYVALSPQKFMKSRFQKMGRFEQIYGKQNEKPAEKYVPRVREFIEKMFDGNVKALQLLGIPLTEMDLRNKDLSGLNFTQLDDPTAYEHRMDGLDFTGSTMTGCVFDENIIENCTFDGCDLRDARFWKVVVDNTTFVDADMRGVNFDLARFIGNRTTFQGANVDKASFQTGTYRDTVVLERLLDQATGAPYHSTTSKREAPR